MAKENIAFLVNLRKNIVEGSKMEGRYYPEAESKEALTTKGFARHVADHGGMVTYEFMQLVLASIVKCLPGGAATIEDALRMGVNNLVQGVNFVFIPENAQGEEITSKKFKDQCSLQFAYLVETIKKKINGKDKSYTLRTPLSAWDIVQSDDSSSAGGPSAGSGTVENGGSETGGNGGGNSSGGSGIIPTPTDPEDDQPHD